MPKNTSTAHLKRRQRVATTHYITELERADDYARVRRIYTDAAFQNHQMA